MSNPDDSKKDDVPAHEDKKDDVSVVEGKKDDGDEYASHISPDMDTVEKGETSSHEKKSDDFFEDTENAKKKSSPLIPLIILFFLCGAFLVFGYIYNIAGIRDKASEYNFEKIPNYLKIASGETTSTPVDRGDVENIVSQEKNLADVKTSSDDLAEKQDDSADSIVEQIDDSKDELIEEKSALDISEEDTQAAAEAEVVAEVVAEPIVKTVTEYVPVYALSKEEFSVHKEKIRALNKEIYSGKTYINQLVAVKGLFPETDLSVMTEYSAIGKPKKFIVAQNGINAVKRAAVLQEVKTDAKIQDIADAVLRKFVVITPTENIDENALDGQLSLIKNAFMTGDFKAALKYISVLPEDREKEFVRVVKVINDLYSLKAEMRQVDDALTEKLYNNKKN